MKTKYCPDCNTPMDMISRYLNGEEYWHCQACHPDPFDREEDRRIDAMDMIAEMTFNDETEEYE